MQFVIRFFRTSSSRGLAPGKPARRLALLLGLIATFCGAADDLAPTVRKLVRQLNAPELVQRDEAEQRLIALGGAVLDSLPTADADLSAEVRQRVTRVRQALQKSSATSAGQASLVTLRTNQRPLSEILRELARQTGNRLVDARSQRGQPATNPQLSLDFQQLPFWQAADRLLDQAQLSLDVFGNQGALQILTRGEHAPLRTARAAYCGPFRIEPVRVVAQRDLRSAENGSLQVLLEIAWEPRLHPISITQRAADLAVFDEAGRPLPTENPRAVLEATVRRGTAAVQTPVLLALPARAVRQIARFQGVLRALLPGPPETFRFERIGRATHVEKRIAGATVTLERVGREGAQWAVEMLLRFDRADVALESHRGWVFDNQAWLEDRTGKQFRPVGTETLRQTENELGMKYLFACPAPLDDCQFLYRTPALILNSTYPYELKGIDLP